MPNSTYIVTLDTSGLKSDISITRKSVDKYIDACLRESCKLVKNYAKKNHKFKNGADRKLEKAIKSMVVSKLREGIVYVDLDQAPYGVYVHEDTGTFFNGRKYPITPVRAKALKFFWERYGKWVTLARVNHPGSKGDKFLEDALDANKGNINDIFSRGLNDLING